MTLILNLAPAEEAQLRAEAAAAGLKPEDYARKRLLGGVQGPQSDLTAELFARWAVEDAPGDSAEISQREAEWTELKSNLNRTRSATGEEPLF
jgi:hypothetical protein